MTTASLGNGGWVRVTDAALPGPLYLRLSNDRGRPFLSELYLDARGAEITSEHLRLIAPRQLSGWVAAGDWGDWLDSSRDRPGPDLSRLASYFATNFGAQARHWVADSMRAQYDNSDVEQPKMGAGPRDERDQGATEARLSSPRDTGLSDDFLRQVRDAYSYALQIGTPPNPYIQRRVGSYSIHTVRGWVREARRRGIMPPGQKGRAV